MASCSACGVELKSGAKFCKACGSGQRTVAQHNDKKSRVLAAEKKSGKTAIALGIAAVAVVTGLLFVVKGKGNVDGAMGTQAPVRPAQVDYTAVAADSGSVRIPLGELRGPEARYFVYQTGGKDVKFFVLKASDGTIRVALDACNACYRAKLGYQQRGDVMMCNNCGMTFPSKHIGVITGGCNPIPVEKRTEGGLVIVQAKDLEAGVKYF